jgi:hypothetical protein
MILGVSIHSLISLDFYDSVSVSTVRETWHFEVLLYASFQEQQEYSALLNEFARS